MKKLRTWYWKFWFFVMLLAILPGTALAQNRTVTLNLDKVPLKTVFVQIEKQTGYTFSYGESVLTRKPYISLKIKDADIQTTLSELSRVSHLDYKVVTDDIILVSAQPEAKEKQKAPIYNQIEGTVFDNEGEPIIGATVMVKGTKIGGATDIEGHFSLNNVPPGSTLVVSYIGCKPKEIKLNGAGKLDIVLNSELTQLNELVVIGYGTISKKELTSAVSHVSSKDMLQTGSSNPAMQIQGKVPGLSVENSTAADPNSSVSMQVRGVSSRNAGLGPLVVIDGVPGGSLDNLNENDIESIDVLKDGAASAIYGTRGSNGVVVVTTKKGATDGRVHTTYSGFVNIVDPIRELDVLTAEEYRQYNRGEDYGANTDWFKEITKVGVSQSHTLSVSGGTSKNNYRATLDYKNTEGIDLRANNRQLGARMTVNHTGKDDIYRFTFNVAPSNVNYRNSDYDAFRESLMINPTIPVMNADTPGKYTYITAYSTNNPVERLKLEKNEGERTFINWDGTFKLNLFPMLCKDVRHSLSTQVTLAQQIIQNNYSWYRPSTSTVAEESGFDGEAKRSYDKNNQQSLEWLVNYGFRNDNHNLTVMGGYSYQYFVNSGLSAENKDFASDLLGADNLGAGAYMGAVAGRKGMSSYKNDSKLIAFFGRLTYNLLDRYFLTASIRHEGSSKFGSNHKWGNFPAVSAGWRISNESFMRDITWLNDLKIRGDYGETGNQDFASYQSLATMASYDLILYKGNYIQGWGINSNPNEDLKWEKGKNWNVGIDFSLFDYRLEGSFNYYSRKQSDLLGTYSVPVPPNVISDSYVNVGTMKNTGIEIELRWNAVTTKDFDYTLSFIGATSDNKFISFSNQKFEGQKFYWMSGFPLYPGNPGALQRIEEGERVGNYYTFKYAGVDDDGNWLVYNKDGEKIPVAQGTDADKRVVGNGMPKFTASLTNNFRYRNFDLTLYFRGAFGYQIYDAQDLYYGVMGAAPGTNVLKSAYAENSHITEGKNVHSSYFVHNGDFVKLDVATLGYTWNIHRYIERVRFYFTGRNLFNIRSYKRGLDPDSYCVNGLQPGIPYSKTGYYPSTRQYLIGVQIDF